MIGSLLTKWGFRLLRCRNVAGCGNAAGLAARSSEGRPQVNGLWSRRIGRRGSGARALPALAVLLFLAALLPLEAQAASVSVSLSHYVFTPSPVTITAGTTVTWVNRDPTEHQIASDTGAFPASKLLKTGQAYSYQFTKVGTYNYHDGFNATIRGTVIVKAGPKATPTPRPTPKPTVKPTPKPTAKPTATLPAPTASAVATSSGEVGPSPASSGAGTGASAEPSVTVTGSPADGSGSGSAQTPSSLDLGSVGIGVLGALMIVAVAGFAYRAGRARR